MRMRALEGENGGKWGWTTREEERGREGGQPKLEVERRTKRRKLGQEQRLTFSLSCCFQGGPRCCWWWWWWRRHQSQIHILSSDEGQAWRQKGVARRGGCYGRKYLNLFSIAAPFWRVGRDLHPDLISGPNQVTVLSELPRHDDTRGWRTLAMTLVIVERHECFRNDASPEPEPRVPIPTWAKPICCNRNHSSAQLMNTAFPLLRRLSSHSHCVRTIHRNPASCQCTWNGHANRNLLVNSNFVPLT